MLSRGERSTSSAARRSLGVSVVVPRSQRARIWGWITTRSSGVLPNASQAIGRNNWVVVCSLVAPGEDGSLGAAALSAAGADERAEAEDAGAALAGRSTWVGVASRSHADARRERSRVAASRRRGTGGVLSTGAERADGDAFKETTPPDGRPRARSIAVPPPAARTAGRAAAGSGSRGDSRRTADTSRAARGRGAPRPDRLGPRPP